jgi:spermidine/putrescine transport system substrate-binding protein
MRDTVGLACQAEGIDPATVTYKQAEPALDRLQKEVEAGQVRRFTGNDYQDDLVDGNFAACVGWSGDVAQLTLDNDALRFVIPEEGGMRWADTMVWVSSAKRKAQVAAWMDYFYDVANAAQVAAYVQFISPVDGIATDLAELEPGLADSPLIFPPEDVQARLQVFNQELSKSDEEKFDERFAEITGK